MKTSPKRRLLLNLRRAINPIRRFTVLGYNTVSKDGRTFKVEVELECRTCKKKHWKTFDGKKVNLAFVVKQSIPLWSNAGAQGKCKHCTKQIRDRRYPLP